MNEQPGHIRSRREKGGRSRPFSCDIRPRLPRIFLTTLHTYAAVGFPDDHGEMLLATENLQPVMAYYHLVLPHRRLRQPLPEPEPTRGSGSLRRWQPVTPAIAARLTDHVWTTTALLSYRVPPHFLDALPDLERFTHRLRNLITAVEGHYQKTKQ